MGAVMSMSDQILGAIACRLMMLKSSFEDAIVECNGWFLVVLAVLMCLAFTVFAGLTIWCVVYKGKKFTGNWKWSKKGVSVTAECK